MIDLKKLYWELNVKQQQLEDAMQCGCACHFSPVTDDKRCCGASGTTIDNLKEAIKGLHRIIRQEENA